MWEHALATALTGRAYGKLLRFPRSEEIFLAGLMHDIGKSVMGIKFPDRYGAMIRNVYNGQGDALETELETFGFDHTMVGEALLRSWNLSKSIEQIVRWHHEPVETPLENRPLTALVALGNQMALGLKLGIGRPESLAVPTQQALEILNVTPEALEGHHEAILQALEMDKSLLTEF